MAHTPRRLAIKVSPLAGKRIPFESSREFAMRMPYSTRTSLLYQPIYEVLH